MKIKVSQSYVMEVLSLQGVKFDSDVAKAIAPLLAAQLAAAAPAYSRLPFETEPATFLVALAQERG